MNDNLVMFLRGSHMSIMIDIEGGHEIPEDMYNAVKEQINLILGAFDEQVHATAVVRDLVLNILNEFNAPKPMFYSIDPDGTNEVIVCLNHLYHHIKPRCEAYELSQYNESMAWKLTCAYCKKPG